MRNLKLNSRIHERRFTDASFPLEEIGDVCTKNVKNYIDVFQKILDVNKGTGFSVIMLRHPKFPLPKPFTVHRGSLNRGSAIDKNRFSRVNIHLLLASLACLGSK